MKDNYEPPKLTVIDGGDKTPLNDNHKTGSNHKTETSDENETIGSWSSKIKDITDDFPVVEVLTVGAIAVATFALEVMFLSWTAKRGCRSALKEAGLR